MPTHYNFTSAVPTTEPLQIGDVKRFLRITHTSEDEDLRNWIKAARVAVESHTGLTVANAAVTFYRSEFPPGRKPLSLPTGPGNSLTSIAYLDEDEAAKTISTGAVSLRNTDYPEIVPDTEWPGVSQYHNDAVTVVYDAGYTTAALVPAGIKHAMLHMIASCYESRGEAHSSAFYELLSPYCRGDEFKLY